MCTRRYIRNYTDEIVDKKTIEHILDIVRYAPSGVNNQPVHWLIVHEPEAVRKISSLPIDWMREMSECDQYRPMKRILPSLIYAYDSGADPICRGAPILQ